MHSELQFKIPNGIPPAVYPEISSVFRSAFRAEVSFRCFTINSFRMSLKKSPPGYSPKI